jgi:hypothetical protein
MLDVLQLKHSVNRMSLEKVRVTVNELQLEGIVTEGKTPCYQGLAYAMFDPSRWEAVEVLRWLKEFVEQTQSRSRSH